jgi:hypothetical protein
MGTGSFPGIKGEGCGVDHPPHLAPRLKKEKSYISPPLWAFVASFRVNFSPGTGERKNENIGKEKHQIDSTV